MKAEIPGGFTEPLKFSQPFRFLVLKTAERIDSSVILDNFTAIYSDNTDLQGPGITVTPAANAEINSSSPSIVLEVNDASGVNFGTRYFAIDATDVSAQAAVNGKDRIEYQASSLAEGWHRIEYRISDINGNVSAGDQLFDVRAGGSRIYIDSDAVTLYPGGTFDVPVRVVGGAQFHNFHLKLAYDSTKATMTALPGDLTAANVGQLAGVWEGDFSGFSNDTSVLMTLRLRVKDYIQSTFISIAVDGVLDGKAFYYPTVRKPVTSKYILMTSWGVQGAASRLLVTDSSGKAAANVNVELIAYNAANDTVTSVTPLGKTDAEGRLTVQLNASGKSEELIFRAYDASGSSLMTTGKSLIERLTATPRYVFLTPGENAATTNVTWFTATSIAGSTVRYGASSFANTAEGTSEILPFFYGTEAGAVRVHHAKMTGLQAGTTYQYDVGDGNTRSATYHFRTDDGDDVVNIHLFGDTQTLSDDNIYNGSRLVSELYSKMQSQLPGGDLILHAGDITDDLTDYRLMRLFFDAMEGEGRLASRLFVPTQGNHEVLNEGAQKYASIFGNRVYSFDYGNAHVAVISSEVSETEWPDMMTWLKQDAAASNRTWKLVILHRPPYNGNPESGNERSRRYLPAAADAAGIDLVISGHDHMYSRTVPLRGGQPDSSGAVYLIAGSDSAKFYDNNGTGVAKLAEVLFDDNLQTFTTLAINGSNLRILTRTLDGRVVDDATIKPRAVRAQGGSR